MRKKFILFVLIPAVVVFLLLYFFIDGWVEAGLEYAGEKAVGARVEIDGLRLSLSPIGAEFHRLQVANPGNPWFNLFETGRVKFALNFGQLLRSKFIIETMEVNDLILGTKRTTDGSLPKPPAEKPSHGTETSPGLVEQAKSALVPEGKKSPVFDLTALRQSLNIDSLINPNNLASYKRIDTLKRQVQTASAEWQRTVDGFDASKAKLTEIESSVKSISVNNIKDVQGALNALNTVKTSAASVNEIVGTFNNQKNALSQNVDQFAGSIRQIDDLVEQDYQNAVKLARLPDVSMTGLAELILGKDVLARAYEYLGYVEMVRNNIPASSSKPPIQTPRRFEGQNIHFPVERAYPKLWIRKVLLSGGTDRAQDPNYFYAKGQILNISNDQRITGVPITADITATQGRGTTLSLEARIDRRSAEPLDEYKARLGGVPVAAMSLGRSDFLPAKITNAVADAGVAVRVPGLGFDSNAKIALRNVKLGFDRDPKNTVERIVRDVLAPITGFGVTLRVWKTAEKFDVAFATDLDGLIASRTKDVLSAELTKIQNDIRNRLNSAIAQKRADLERLYTAKRDDVMGKVRQYETQVKDKLAQVEAKKKELESKVEAEKKKQTDSLKQKAGDALKNILKR